MSGSDEPAVGCRHGRWRYGAKIAGGSAGAFIIYLLLAWLVFGRALIGHFNTSYIGADADALQFMWYLRWWPYALAHHLNPLWPRIIWPPSGVNLAWAASIPLPSLIAAPLTLTIGVIPTFNLLSLIAPALAGWAAYLLCRELFGAHWPALLGGFVFAFSAHMLGKCFGNLNDALVFPIPLAVWAAVRFVKERLSTLRFALLAAVLLITQFLCFTELFATMTLMGGFVWLVGLVLTDGATRARLIAMVRPLIAAYAIALAVLSPYLYFIFAFPMRQAEIMPAKAFSIDLLNFLIPSDLNELGKPDFIRHIASHYGAGLMESGGYIALPLLLIAIFFARGMRREPYRRWLVYSLIGSALFALGPNLQISGRTTAIVLPWRIVTNLPLVQKALPARLMVYVFLALAVVVSWWLSESNRRNSIKLAAAGATAVFMLPNLTATYWATASHAPEFFTTSLYQRYLKPHDKVLILPFGINGDAMLWQALAGMNFRMVEGWTGFPKIPAEFEQWPIVQAMTVDAGLPDAEAQIRGFLAANQIDAIIVADHCFCVWNLEFDRDRPMGWRRDSVTPAQRERWSRWFAATGVAPLEVGGVTLYRLRPTEPDREITLDELDRRDTDDRFDRLFRAAALYTQSGQDAARLTPVRAVQLGLLPGDWLGDHPTVRDEANAPLVARMLLGQWDDGSIAVGLIAPYSTFSAISQKYQPLANGVHYIQVEPPYGAVKKPRDDRPLLVIFTFTPAALRAAAARYSQVTMRWSD